jgi:hypothetical protein
MMAVEDILLPQRLANANRDGFLSDAEVRGCAHLLLPVTLGQDFFGAPNAQEILVETNLIVR